MFNCTLQLNYNFLIYIAGFNSRYRQIFEFKFIITSLSVNRKKITDSEKKFRLYYYWTHQIIIVDNEYFYLRKWNSFLLHLIKFQSNCDLSVLSHVNIWNWICKFRVENNIIKYVHSFCVLNRLTNKFILNYAYKQRYNACNVYEYNYCCTRALPFTFWWFWFQFRKKLVPQFDLNSSTAY